MKPIYYIGKQGDIFTVSDLEKAFTIWTGLHRSEYPGSYLRWLHALFGATIVAAKPLTEDELIRAGRKSLAVIQLHKTQGMSLHDAKQKVDEIEKHLTE